MTVHRGSLTYPGKLVLFWGKALEEVTNAHGGKEYLKMLHVPWTIAADETVRFTVEGVDGPMWQQRDLGDLMGILAPNLLKLGSETAGLTLRSSVKHRYRGSPPLPAEDPGFAMARLVDEAGTQIGYTEMLFDPGEERWNEEGV